jgi:hypothetical protein
MSPTKIDVLACAVMTVLMALLTLTSANTRFFFPLAVITIISVVVTIAVTSKVEP